MKIHHIQNFRKFDIHILVQLTLEDQGLKLQNQKDITMTNKSITLSYC